MLGSLFFLTPNRALFPLEIVCSSLVRASNLYFSAKNFHLYRANLNQNRESTDRFDSSSLVHASNLYFSVKIFICTARTVNRKLDSSLIKNQQLDSIINFSRADTAGNNDYNKL